MSGLSQLLKDINEFLAEDDGRVEITDEGLRLTIGTRTLLIRWPEVYGVESTDSLWKSPDKRRRST